MTDPIPYEVIEDGRGPRVIRGADLIGWTSEARDAESFARELNALQSANARLRARVGRLEAVEQAARECLRVGDSYSSLYNVNNMAARQALRAALEATDGE